MTLKIDEASIVVVGSLNPTIFQPKWLLAEQLISEDMAGITELKIIHQAVAHFQAGWLEFQATENRLTARTTDASSFMLLRDFVSGLFGILEHTPVRMLGINRLFHFSISSEEKWHHIGHELAPKTHWEGLLEKPGTLSLTMQGKRPSSPAAYLRVKTEPSMRVMPGLHFDFNEHYQQADDEVAASFVGQVLMDQFASAQQYFLTTATDLLRRLGGEQ